MIFGYLFLDSGFNTETKVRVNYKYDSNVYVSANYLEIMDDNMADKYIANMIDSININYEYNKVLSEYVTGYYKYNVLGYLKLYHDNQDDILWEKCDNLVSDKVILLDKNDVNSIKIDDFIKVDFKKYVDEINKVSDEAKIEMDGYLELRINILEFLNFYSLDNEYADNKTIVVKIPLTEPVFTINVDKLKNTDSYYEFNKKRMMNLVFLIIGAFLMSLSVSMLIMVIGQFKKISARQSLYRKELKKILTKYDNEIVRVNKLFVNRKYNMIYVDSFSELMDVCKLKNEMISFKEVKRDSVAIFVVISDNDAWIYRIAADGFNY